MSANFGSESPHEVDLNITPIIDCFTVLITFLLASASFLSIGFFEVSTPGLTTESVQEEPSTELIVKVKTNHITEFKEKGRKNETLRFDLSKPSSSLLLRNELELLKKPPYKVNQILVSAEDEVGFESIAETMSQLNQANLPVILGEF